MRILHFPVAGILKNVFHWKRKVFSQLIFLKEAFLSLGKAAELAELKLGAFIHFLDELEIPVIDYDEDELNAEFNIAKKLKEA